MKPGEKCVCVKDGKWLGNITLIGRLPKKWEIYTIDFLDEKFDHTFCALVEIAWSPPEGGRVCFRLDCFRPLNLVDSFDSEAYLEWLERVLPELEPIEK